MAKRMMRCIALERAISSTMKDAEKACKRGNQEWKPQHFIDQQLEKLFAFSPETYSTVEKAKDSPIAPGTEEYLKEEVTNTLLNYSQMFGLNI